MEKTLFAFDFSGSVQYQSSYHDISQNIIAALPADTIIFAWDSKLKRISHAELKEINVRRQGSGGTDASQIARACDSAQFRGGHLVILTDGDVSNIDACDELVTAKKFHFSRVTVHIVAPKPNVSVAAPFVRACPHEILHYHTGSAEPTRVGSVSAADLAVIGTLDAISTEAEFDAALPALREVIRAATMGTAGDPVMRDRLLAMRERIVHHKARVAAEAASSSSDKKERTLLDMAASASFEEAEAAIRTMVKTYYGASSKPTAFEAHMSQLINMCQGALRSQFDLGAIKAQRAARSDVAMAAEQPPEMLDATAASACPALTCPITMENDGDMLLLVKRPKAPLMSLLDAKAANDVIDNPLNALFHQDFMAALRDHLDTPVSLAAYRAAAESGSPLLVSPLTRAPLCGALAFGAHPEHAAASDWTLAQLLAGGKLLGNINLWYAVLWLAVAGDAYFNPGDAKVNSDNAVEAVTALAHQHAERARRTGTTTQQSAADTLAPLVLHATKQGLPRLAPMIPLMEAQLRWRLHHRKSYASLSGRSQYVCTRVPLGEAVWYVLHACLLKPAANVDPLRLYIGHTPRLATMLRVCGAAIDPRVVPHLFRLLGLFGALKACKRKVTKNQCTALERYQLSAAALHRNAIVVDTADIGKAIQPTELPLPFLLLDGPVNPAVAAAARACLPSQMQCLPVAEIVALVAMVHPSKSAADIELPFDWTAPPLPAYADEWKIIGSTLEEEEERLNKTVISICPATCRPFYRPDGKLWSDACTSVFGPPEELMKCDRLVGMFVAKFKAYPNTAEFLLFAWNRLVRHAAEKPGVKAKTALPQLVLCRAQATLSRYKTIFATIEPEEFIRRWNASCNPVRRERMEQSQRWVFTLFS